jgi:ferredoxin
MSVFSLHASPRIMCAGLACVRTTVKDSRCVACTEVCPTGAISLTGEGMIAMDPQACVGCGYCLFNCPTDAPEGIAAPQRHYCAERLVMPLSVVAPCTEELLMWHSEYGIRFVEMDTDSAAGWLQAVAMLNVHLRRMEEPLWNIVPPSPQKMNGSRRRWLHLKNEGVSAGSVPTGRRARRARFTHISEYQPELDTEHCSLCGACSRVCPEEAIRLDDHAITLDPVKCTGCGNCEAVCFDGALSVQENNEGTLTVHRLERKECRICRRLFSAWSVQEKECGVCRRHAFGMREA